VYVCVLRGEGKQRQSGANAQVSERVPLTSLGELGNITAKTFFLLIVGEDTHDDATLVRC
jgi:hypothetical protein